MVVLEDSSYCRILTVGILTTSIPVLVCILSTSILFYDANECRGLDTELIQCLSLMDALELSQNVFITVACLQRVRCDCLAGENARENGRGEPIRWIELNARGCLPTTGFET